MAQDFFKNHLKINILPRPNYSPFKDKATIGGRIQCNFSFSSFRMVRGIVQNRYDVL